MLGRFGSGDNEWDFLKWKKRKRTRFQYAITEPTIRPTYQDLYWTFVGYFSSFTSAREARGKNSAKTTARETNKFNPFSEPQIADNIGDEGASALRQSVCADWRVEGDWGRLLFLWQYGLFIRELRFSFAPLSSPRASSWNKDRVWGLGGRIYPGSYCRQTAAPYLWPGRAPEERASFKVCCGSCVHI